MVAATATERGRDGDRGKGPPRRPRLVEKIAGGIKKP
jgi:hypothetical protein